MALADPYISAKPTLFGCSSNFEHLALQIMAQENLVMPRTLSDARNLYNSLLDFIDNIWFRLNYLESLYPISIVHPASIN